MPELIDQSNQTSLPKPTKSVERIFQLDIFRGFAIFGIFMVNILVMNCVYPFRGTWEIEMNHGIQQVALFMLGLLFYSKFFPIFSFLFGIGVALQIEKFNAQKITDNLFLPRRFLALFVFGMAHLLFLWSGDILHLYAAIGLFLLLVSRLPSTYLLILSVVLFVFPFFDDIYQLVFNALEVEPQYYLNRMPRETMIELKRDGAFAESVHLRMKEYGFMLPVFSSLIAPIACSMALLGMYVVRRGALMNLTAFARRIGPVFVSIVILLLVFKYLFVYLILPRFDIAFGSILSFVLWTLYYLAEIGLGLLYLWLLTLLLRRPFWKKLLSPLQYVGRMAFTNYILQSVVGLVLMNTFGMYEKFSPVECIVIVVVVFACQIPLSMLWLRTFKYGPLEWLWRCISYWKLLPIR